MSDIDFPKNFPSEENMIEKIKLSLKHSWHISKYNKDINKWLANFVGDVYCANSERKLALWMLLNFTYYNEEEKNYLLKILYKKLLHLIFEKEQAKGNLKNKEDAVKIENRIFYSGLGGAGNSGEALLYKFRSENDICINNCCSTFELNNLSNDSIIVFIDDVFISGRTANDFYNNTVKCMKFSDIYFASIFATNEAISILESKGLSVSNCILLTDRDKCFSEKSLMFNEFPDLKEYAKEMSQYYGARIRKSFPLGFEDGQYAFGLHYNTPNNTLPIFWGDTKWEPFFVRNEKRYTIKKGVKANGKYI